MTDQKTTTPPENAAPAAAGTPTGTAVTGTPQTVTPVSADACATVPKIKTRKPKQRACDEKDAKAKLCMGHLKRWYDYPPEIAKLVGKGAEVYRCEFCRTIYRPDPQQLPNSYTLRY